MQNQYEIEIDNLAIALTKPALQFGVPMAAFYANVMIFFLGWMFAQNFVFNKNLNTIIFFIGFLFTYVLMAWITIKDTQGLMITWLNLKSFRKHKSFGKWGNTDSYSL